MRIELLFESRMTMHGKLINELEAAEAAVQQYIA